MSDYGWNLAIARIRPVAALCVGEDLNTHGSSRALLAMNHPADLLRRPPVKGRLTTTTTNLRRNLFDQYKVPFDVESLFYGFAAESAVAADIASLHVRLLALNSIHSLASGS